MYILKSSPVLVYLSPPSRRLSHEKTGHYFRTIAAGLSQRRVGECLDGFLLHRILPSSKVLTMPSSEGCFEGSYSSRGHYFALLDLGAF